MNEMNPRMKRKSPLPFTKPRGDKTATDGQAIRSLKAILTQDTMTGMEFDQE